MTYEEVLTNAKKNMSPKCRVCPECNGLACRGELPGVGGVGNGRGFTICRDYLKQIKLNMDTLYEEGEVSLETELLGKVWNAPFMVSPIGGMAFNYNGYLTDLEYNEMMLAACQAEGIAAFSGDTPDAAFFQSLLPLIEKSQGSMISTVKPWPNEMVIRKALELKQCGAEYLAMDVDSAGLPALWKNGMGGHPKSEKDLREIMEASGMKLIVKGVMTAKGALTAKEAGAAAIIVSTHGGRHYEDAPATAEVLPEIRAAVGPEYPIFADGGIRSGADILKVIALGADAAMIGRPFAIAAHGGREEGIRLYIQKLKNELTYAMMLTGCKSVKEISKDIIRGYES